MLEPCVNQAAGLQGLALQLAPRLMGVASHGQQQGELPLLWGLCNQWVDMGLSVMVLDGHSRESQTNPGLAQWLDNPLDRLGEDFASADWSVLPAAAGLARLAPRGLLRSPLADLFKGCSLIVVYTGAGQLAQLLKGSGLAPLLVAPPAQAATVSAYQALKQLFLDGQLQPTVANIVPDMSLRPSVLQSAQKLADCAVSFLGYRVRALTVTASTCPERSQADLVRLALQLLENALPLARQPEERVH